MRARELRSSPLIRVSAATGDDLASVLEVLRECQLPEQGVAEGLDRFLIARVAGALVGCAGLEVHGKAGLLRSVAVREAARDLGVGSELVARVVERACAEQLGELFLLTTTAAPFFERRGFCLAPRSSAPPELADSWEFRAGCPQAARCLRLPLVVTRGAP